MGYNFVHSVLVGEIDAISSKCASIQLCDFVKVAYFAVQVK